MKHTLFLFISFFFLALAFFHDPLYATYPDIFEPINKFVNNVGFAILYIAGFLALFIAVFSWLPTWGSLLLFIALTSLCGFHLSNKEVSISTEDKAIFITIKDK